MIASDFPSRGKPSGSASMTAPGRCLELGRIGRRNSEGMPFRSASCRSRMKKAFAPVAMPRLIAKKSPSVCEGSASDAAPLVSPVHFLARRRAVRATVSDVAGLVIGPPKDRRT